MKQIVIKAGRTAIDSWVSRISELTPGFEVLSYRSPSVREKDVDYIIAWRPDALWINTFSNLKAVVSMASGVDHINNLKQLKKDIPVLRTVSPNLSQKMREYITMCVLTWHRKLLPMLEANKTRDWKVFDAQLASDLTVGIMGFGGMGKATADTLAALGYNIKLWSKSPRDNTPYPYFNGKENLNAFASGCDVIICLLPITKETEGVLNYNLFSSMNKGSCLINAARGQHLINDDLIRALDEGQLLHAFLDVTEKEPLPKNDSAWDIKNTVLTFHSAAYINSEVGSKIIAENLLAYEKGEYNGAIYDPALGY